MDDGTDACHPHRGHGEGVLEILLGFSPTTAPSAGSSLVFLVLPLVAAVALFLIADIDSPRWGVIRVVPQNLLSLAHSLRSP